MRQSQHRSAQRRSACLEEHPDPQAYCIPGGAASAGCASGRTRNRTVEVGTAIAEDIGQVRVALLERRLKIDLSGDEPGLAALSPHPAVRADDRRALLPRLA